MSAPITGQYDHKQVRSGRTQPNRVVGVIDNSGRVAERDSAVSDQARSNQEAGASSAPISPNTATAVSMSSIDIPAISGSAPARSRTAASGDRPARRRHNRIMPSVV